MIVPGIFGKKRNTDALFWGDGVFLVTGLNSINYHVNP